MLAITLGMVQSRSMSEYLHDTTKAVIFDHDDTLVGTIEAKWAQHKHTAKTWYDKELTHEEIKLHWGKPLRTLVSLLYETDDVDLAFERIMGVHTDFPKLLLPDTLPTLNVLQDAGLTLGLVTATSRFSLEHDLENLAIPPELFGYIQTEEDTNFHKPDARVFDPAKRWLDSQGIAPHEVTYVGDGLHDAKVAQDNGFNFVGVETGLVTKEMFVDAGFISISSLSKLISSKNI